MDLAPATVAAISRRRMVLSCTGSCWLSRLGAWMAPLLPPEFAQLFDDWFLQDAIDERSLDWIRNWQRSPEFAGAFQFAGVPLAPGLEYGLMEMILTQYFGVYSGVRS